MESMRRPLFIGLEAVETGEWDAVVNPWDGTVVAEAAVAGAGEMDRAVAAAVAAAPSWRRRGTFERVAVLDGVAAGLVRRREELVDTIVAEAGKPVRLAGAEVDRAVNTFTLAAEEAKRLGGEVLPLDLLPDSAGRLGLTSRFPRGVIAAVTPFNFPLNLVAHKVAPALAGGNTLVVKPASQAPLSAILLGEIGRGAGLPPGVLNVVPAGARVAERLVTDTRVAMVTFTGSAEVGWKVRAAAGKKKVLLELGGDAAAVVEPDADLPFAAERIALGGFAYAGQVCISVQRILVHRKIYGPFRALFLEAVARLRTGDPRDPEVIAGPLISDEAAGRVEAWIAEAVAAGATLIAGGRRRGRMISPAVLEGVGPGVRLGCGEVFGPVVTLAPYDDFAGALARVNASPYGLQAGVFTARLDAAFEAFRELEVGGVIVNDYPTYRIDHMPYGGVKESGLGREGLRWAIAEMTEERLLVLNLARPG